MQLIAELPSAVLATDAVTTTVEGVFCRLVLQVRRQVEHVGAEPAASMISLLEPLQP